MQHTYERAREKVKNTANTTWNGGIHCNPSVEAEVGGWPKLEINLNCVVNSRPARAIYGDPVLKNKIKIAKMAIIIQSCHNKF